VKSERGNTRLHDVENSLWKRLWTCLEIKYEMNCEQLLSKRKHTAFPFRLPTVYCGVAI